MPVHFSTVFDVIMYEYAKLIADSATQARAGLVPAERTSKEYWRFVAMTYKKLQDGRISSSSVLRENKLLVQGEKQCAYCESTDSLQWVHLIPQSRNGPDTIDNMILSCPACNQEKGNRNPIEWYDAKMLHRKQVPRLVMGKLLKVVLEEHRRLGTLLLNEYPKGSGLHLYNVCLVFDQKPDEPTV